MTTEIVLGPAMLALTEKRRKFVWALTAHPWGKHSDWARDAGYSDIAEGCKVRASELLQDEKVRAAIMEVAHADLHGIGPALAVAGMIRIAADPEHKDNAKAIEMIANRTGFAEKQQIEIVHRDLTGDALLERMRLLAEKHGIDPTKFFGISRETKLIEQTREE